MKSGVFVSDLHHFASRSQDERYEKQICHAAETADLVVLGGDIFDFHWSTLGSLERSIGRAIEWLKQLTEAHPNCQFVYVLGNHDYHTSFICQLDQLCLTTDNLSFHRFFYRTSDCIFIHGDVADGHVSQSQLIRHRDRWHSDKLHGPLKSKAYGLATNLRLHVPIIVGAHPRLLMAKRIVRYLEDINETYATGVRRVYFGHTHRVMNAYQFGGLTFFNGGAPMKGLPFELLRFHFDSETTEI